MKRIFFYAILCLFALFLAELFLYAASMLWPIQESFPTIADRVLGHRPNPKHPEHDRKGFRNKEVPETVDIVALGDSQTYGEEVKQNETWAKQLQTFTGFTVYNMSYGGYGPTHSLMLLEEALELSPRIVIEAFYSGNDLYDAFNLSYYMNNDLDFLKTEDQQLREAIQKEEATKSLKQYIEEIYNYQTFSDSDAQEKIEHENTPWLYKIKHFAYNHTKLYRLLADFKGKVLYRPNYESLWIGSKEHALKYPKDCLIFETADFRTIFTPRYRLAAVNIDDPRIYEGLNISLKAISLMKKRLDAVGVQFKVVFIPTKELVFSQWVDKHNTTNDSAIEDYYALLRNEQKVWALTRDYLQTHNIDFLDSLPCLQESLSKQKQPYLPSTNGHPNYFGHNAIARCLQAGDFLAISRN